MLSVAVDVSVACDDVASLIYFPYTKRSQTVQTATKRRFSLPAPTSASASAVSLARSFVSFCRAFAGINVDVGIGFGMAGAKHSLNGALSVQCCQTLSVLSLSLSVIHALFGNAVSQLFQAQLEQQQQHVSLCMRE